MFGRLRPSRPGHTTVIAYLALFLALGGSSAYAINEWNGSNIQDGTLESADLKDGDVRNVDLKPEAVGTTRLKNDDVRSGDVKDADLAPQDLDLIGKDVITTEESTSSSTLVDLATVGPSVTVNVPSSGMVAFRAEVELKADAGASAVVAWNCDGLERGILNAASTSFVRRGTVPGSTSGTQLNNGWVLIDLDPGVHTCKVKYLRSGGSGTATFKNRKLWVMAVD
jgi:hypothetical protein